MLYLVILIELKIFKIILILIVIILLIFEKLIFILFIIVMILYLNIFFNWIIKFRNNGIIFNSILLVFDRIINSNFLFFILYEKLCLI